MDFNLKIDPQYIVLVILVTETIIKYFGSKIKDKSWVALAVATAVGVINFLINWSSLEGADQKYDFVYSLIINYTVATSFYELILKKVKKIIGAKLGGDQTPPTPTEEHIEDVHQEIGVGNNQQQFDTENQDAMFDAYKAEMENTAENKSIKDARSIINKYIKGNK